MKDRRELGLKEKSGVLFHRKISWMYKGKKENTFFSYLLELILIFLTAFGMLFGFVESLEIQVDKQALLIGIILFTILFQFAFVIKGITKYAVAVLSMGWLIAFFLFFTQIKQGFITVANQIVYSINYYYDINLLEFHSLPEETTYFCTVLLLFGAFMAIGIIGWVVCGKGLRTFYILATFPFIMMPFLVGVIPNEFLLISYSLAAITILGNGFRLQTDIRMKVRKILFLFSFLLFTLVYLLFPPKSYQNNINLEQVKIQLQKKAREFSESDILNDIFHGGLFSKVSIASGGLSNGKLGRVSEVKFQKKTDLILTVPYKMRDSFM